jgi:hypothetical protein
MRSQELRVPWTIWAFVFLNYQKLKLWVYSCVSVSGLRLIRTGRLRWNVTDTVRIHWYSNKNRDWKRERSGEMDYDWPFHITCSVSLKRIQNQRLEITEFGRKVNRWWSRESESRWSTLKKFYRKESGFVVQEWKGRIKKLKMIDNRLNCEENWGEILRQRELSENFKNCFKWMYSMSGSSKWWWLRYGKKTISYQHTIYERKVLNWMNKWYQTEVLGISIWIIVDELLLHSVLCEIENEGEAIHLDNCILHHTGSGMSVFYRKHRSFSLKYLQPRR